MNILLAEKQLPAGPTLHIIQGDITIEEVDAVVNAANEHLQHGGGLTWAIVKRGGEVIQRESNEWIRRHGLVKHSAPAWTSGGNLVAKFIIHAVGPVWCEGDEDAKLTAAVQGSLKVADQLRLQSNALPAISTGAYQILGYTPTVWDGIAIASFTMRTYPFKPGRTDVLVWN